MQFIVMPDLPVFSDDKLSDMAFLGRTGNGDILWEGRGGMESSKEKLL